MNDNPEVHHQTSDMGAQPPFSLEARRRRVRRMRIINVPMRWLLRLPFPTPLNRRLMLLFFRGRKTGRSYRQPVSYVRDGNALLTPGGGNWKLNLREDQAIRISLRGHSIQARPEFVRDPSEVTELIRKMMIENPRVTSFVPFVSPEGQIDQSGLRAALTYGFCIVRWHLFESGTSTRI
jgi:hypothetical protein